MNTSEHIPTMYESVPAVAGLNRVPGFEPFKLLRRIASPGEGKVALQLDLRFKKLWFRLAYPKGRIRLNPLRITEQMAVFEAQVYFERGDENPVGSFTSCCTKEDAPGGQYVQAAQFEAMDEALTNAGFGVQFADVSMDAAGSRYGSRILLPEKSAAGNTVMVSSCTGAAEKAEDNRNTGHTGTASNGRESTGTAAGSNRPAGVQNTAPAKAMKEKPAGTDPAPAMPVRESLPVQAAASKGTAVQLPIGKQEKSSQAVGTARAFHPVLAQGQAAKPAVNAARPAVGTNPVPPVTAQEQTARPAVKDNPAQPVMVSGRSTQPAGEKRAVQAQNAGAAPTAVQKPASPSAGNGKPVQAAPAAAGQKQSSVQFAGSSLPVQPQVVRSQPVQNRTTEADTLPVKPPESHSLPEQQGTAASAAPAENELPVRASESNGIATQPETMGTATMPADTLPVPEKSSAASGTKSSVQGAMALLSGQNLQKQAAGLPAGNGIAVSAAPPAGQTLPVSGSVAKGEAVSRYTPDMPVEEIVKLMTFEEAEKMVVDIGVCKGMTMAEVAERRQPSLKFYLYGGYKGGNNCLRAAAQIMLDSLAMQKAG